MLESTYFAVHSCFRYSGNMAQILLSGNHLSVVICVQSCAWSSATLYQIKVCVLAILENPVYGYNSIELQHFVTEVFFYLPRNYVWGIISAVALLHRFRYWLRRLLRLLRLRRSAERVSTETAM